MHTYEKRLDCLLSRNNFLPQILVAVDHRYLGRACLFVHYTEGIGPDIYFSSEFGHVCVMHAYVMLIPSTYTSSMIMVPQFFQGGMTAH